MPEIDRSPTTRLTGQPPIPRQGGLWNSLTRRLKPSELPVVSGSKQIEIAEGQNKNIEKLFTLLGDGDLDPRVNTNILQSVFAPTEEYLPTQWPSLNEADYGDFYKHPYEVLKKPEYRDKVLRNYSHTSANFILDYISIVNSQIEGGSEAIYRWSPEEYQAVLYTLLTEVSEDTAMILIRNFEINDILVSPDSGYNPLKKLFLDNRVQNLSFASRLREVVVGKMHNIIKEEVTSDRQPRAAHESAFNIYKDLIIQLTQPTKDNSLKRFIANEIKFLMSIQEDGPLFSQEIFKDKVWPVFSSETATYIDMDAEIELIARQVLPSSNDESERFIIEDKQDEEFIRTLIQRVGEIKKQTSYYWSADNKCNIVNPYLRSILTSWVIGDTIFAEPESS